MKILYYDCFCGISGDMNLAALIDLGVPKEYLMEELSKINLNTEYEIKIERSAKLGITGTRVDVILNDKSYHKIHVSEQASHGDNHKHAHEHSHEHSNHNNDEEQHQDENNDSKEGHVHNHEHHHRSLKDIEKIINSSGLNDGVKKLSLDMFMKVAEAEAKVHGKTLYEVHFHEVGAIDSIVDMVGAAICLDFLKADKIMASPVQVGGGFVKCAHGLMPVPAPATIEILKNIPVKFGIVPFETTTPTGAAILAVNVGVFTENMNFSVEKIGYGIGHRDLEIPNVLRIYLGSEDRNNEREEQYILETNIDDMNPELYGHIEEKLFAQGALDVFRTAISMKKGRTATKLSVLVNGKQEKNVLEVIFKETTSIGIRKYKVEKMMLKRDFVEIKTKYGNVTVKNAYYQGEKVKYKPEYEDCKRIANEKNIPIDRVYKEVYKMMEVNDFDK
ncbi:hypothetical protein HNQ80_001117 [Anaerosolibacter carboniphilus]|uniref:Pyridinium-3,5-bisthiocarboxylic acid mononucleotide nickel insertion protein n=1 Tax=Anaerosolibacter carboniphilus TaxID=1417629 RepID=A0A841KSA9_9FIRM|nr:nickel pincer cofactor biosynthesis protein LarC [Anaerosolibacter carboniphilus]MBB6215028.1 hypothetical protein [Anaerosolibacter carboniphilus]